MSSSHACAVFIGLSYRTIGFWAAGRWLSLSTTIVSDFSPKSGLWRGSQHSMRRTATSRLQHRGLMRRQTMQKGTVKWFNPTKGYGFIKPASGDKDVFVHISAVERAGLRTLNEGQAVEYELVTNRGRPRRRISRSREQVKLEPRPQKPGACYQPPVYRPGVRFRDLCLVGGQRAGASRRCAAFRDQPQGLWIKSGARPQAPVRRASLRCRRRAPAPSSAR